ncbi:hypothetical protein FHS29_004564 [Saccharothrix tamanrassetensis]|uniref:Uncharacterized protein n=1 Tax=Saccharothrix tamanrassetensis TaxID=1051531 RepID=A0A841CR35_9PSEU|nr:hypothetical protein [Saccharothrix tamanrassetensis]MBB5957956.1 hypothetical protein [Saccharothrix tamanrassetensis]
MTPARWRYVLRADVPVSGGVHAVRVGDRVHLFAARPDGDGVGHVVVSGGGSWEVRDPLPLRTVSGAAAGPGGPVVAGARLGDHAAVVLADTETLLAEQHEVAAWPVPVDGDPARVVLATGRAPATVWVGTPGEDSRSVLLADEVLGLQAAAAPAGVDLLCETSVGARFLRVESDVRMERAMPSGSFLSPGAVLAARPPGVGVWSPDTDTRRKIALPGMDIRRLSLVDGLLAWTVREADEPVAAWLARLDPTGTRAERATRLPDPGHAAVVRRLGGEIVVAQEVCGRLEVWLGTLPP